MGLRFFKRRNKSQRAKSIRAKEPLQWGCAFSSAEITAKGKRYIFGNGASMGLRFFKRRNLNSLGAILLFYLLQWGCAFSSAEMSRRLLKTTNLICFNGAALFQAQKLIRNFFKKPYTTSFNGAALFQAQK